MKNSKALKYIVLLPAAFIISSCATYYQKNSSLMSAVYKGDLKSAEELLKDDNKWMKPARNKLLFYLNKGTVLWMAGKNRESIKYFTEADYFVEDFRKNYAETFVSFLTNPNYTTYSGETFEQIMIHYYNTMNFVQMGDYENALVACKRLIETQQRITDRFKGKNKYKRDAFGHTLLGIIYDASGDYNGAFTAYRNAYDIYKEDYTVNLATPAPLQLKKDLIRTAYLSGFSDEVEKYEGEFGLKREDVKRENGNVVFFWNNGLGPVKDQWSINFTVIPAGGGWVHFTNWDLGLNFPFYVGNQDDRNSLTALKVIRVAFPKYVTRKPVFETGALKDSLGNEYKLDMAEDINAIAYRSLEDRMLKEMGESLLRLALKQATEAALRKKNEAAGMALSIFNAVTEQADTRNWQLLPYSIYYTRVSLPEGPQKLTLHTSGNNQSETNTFFFQVKKGKTVVQAFQTLQFSGYADKFGKPYYY